MYVSLSVHRTRIQTGNDIKHSLSLVGHRSSFEPLPVYPIPRRHGLDGRDYWPLSFYILEAVQVRHIWLLWNESDRSVSVPMTLSDLEVTQSIIRLIRP